VYFSPYAERVTGYTAASVEGRQLDQPDLGLIEATVLREMVDELFQIGEISPREIEIVRRDGDRRWLIWNARVLKEVDGEPAILAIGQDVSEQKQAVEKLVQSERLAAIGEAMTGLAHESRNALQRSQANLELLAAELEGQPEQLELVGQIQKAQNHLHQLYEEVRQYAAPLRISPERCDLADLIEETWAHLAVSRKGRQAELAIRRAECPDAIFADRFMIEQVLRNILENALAACADPVVIDVHCRATRAGSAEFLEVSIRDNGPGLTAEQRQRIFDPFYTTKTRGTGLGMTLSRRMIQAHGGTIRVGDGPGGEIILQLPVRPSA
jgi:PAS domain S-box-containing protein